MNAYNGFTALVWDSNKYPKSLDAALSNRREWGGWIFHAEDNRVFWFDMEYTPSEIFRHPLTAGLSGKLI
jgi:hypothetical protein